MTHEELWNALRAYLNQKIEATKTADENIVVRAAPLSTDEAIGNPEHDDYPLQTGRERMMEATFRGFAGQAFTDMFGNYEDRLRDIAALELRNNFRRAVFVATLNAVARACGDVDDTRHCRDEGPVECANELREFVRIRELKPPFLLIGFQPRLAETLHSLGEVRVVDMDVKHIGKEKFGGIILPPEKTAEAQKGCQTAFVTGTTLVNDTLHPFLNLGYPTVFYGVTIAAAARILGLKRFCARGR